MTIPQISVTIGSPSCNQLELIDKTCDYDAESCSCGYDDDSPPQSPLTGNIAKTDVIKTVVILTTPDGSTRYTIDKGYLPTDVDAMEITCADLGATATVITTQTSTTNSCGCTTTVTNTSTDGGACFYDGCWNIQYDVYTNSNKVTYDFTDASFPLFIASIDYNGSPVVINKVCSNITDVINALNTATTNIGSFFQDGDNAVSAYVSDSSLYGTINFGVEYIYDLTGLTLPNTFVSFVVNSVPYSVNQPIALQGDIATYITSFGVGTAVLTGQTTLRVLSANVFGAISFDLEFNEDSPPTPNVNPSTSTPTALSKTNSVVPIVAASTSQSLFISCTIKKQIKDIMMKSFGSDCGCADIQFTICDLNADFDTMILIANGDSLSCACSCAAEYYDRLQKKVARILNNC